MNEKIKVVLPQGVNEIIVREGKAPELLPNLRPIQVDIKGIMGSVTEFLDKRRDQEEQINPKRCHVQVDRERKVVMLFIAENDPYLSGGVSGKMELHPMYVKFGINSDKKWEPNQLGQFFKMNRAFFPDKSKNMALVTELKNFIAKVNSTVEKQKAENGSFADNYSGVVSSNLPETFSLQMPIYKGTPAEIFEVEFYATVDGRSVTLQLFSPSASQLEEEMRDKVIDAELDKIKALCPEIAIIEI